MIPRTGRPAPAPSALTLTPRDTSGDLPPWAPTPPPSGWTPATARQAAQDYAEEHELDLGIPARRLAACAFRELKKATPGLSKADVLARLADAQEEPEDDDEPAPF